MGLIMKRAISGILVLGLLAMHPLQAQQGIAQPWQDAFKARDLAALTLLYTPNAVLETPEGRELGDITSIANYWNGKLNLVDTVWYLTDVRTVVIGDHAVVTGQFLITDQVGVLVEAGTFSQIWQQRGTHWSVHRERWSVQ